MRELLDRQPDWLEKINILELRLSSLETGHNPTINEGSIFDFVFRRSPLYNSYFPVFEEESVSPRSNDNYYPVKEVTRSFNGDIEYIDEIIDEDAISVQDTPNKGRMGSLVIDGNDKRPKCQPVGAQIDCR